MALDDYDDQIIGPAVWLAIASVLGWDADNPPPPPPPTLRRYHRRWAKFYSHAWDLASFIVTAIMVYTERRMYLAKDFRVTFMTCEYLKVCKYLGSDLNTDTLTTARAFQCLFMLSSLIEQSFYPIQHLILLGFLTASSTPRSKCITNSQSASHRRGAVSLSMLSAYNQYLPSQLL
jgi:hypothetical protein